MWTCAPFKHVYFFLPKMYFMQTSEKLSNGRNRGNAWGNELYIVWPYWKEVVIMWILLLFLWFNHIPETRKYYNTDNCNMKQKSFTEVHNDLKYCFLVLYDIIGLWVDICFFNVDFWNVYIWKLVNKFYFPAGLIKMMYYVGNNEPLIKTKLNNKKQNHNWCPEKQV